MSKPSSRPIPLKDILQIVGALAVGMFFGYRLLTGWMSANMDVTIESSRVHLTAEEDWIAVTVKLSRGEYGTLELGDSQARITRLDVSEPPAIVGLTGTQRLGTSEGKLAWQATDKAHPNLNLHANEKSQFSAALKVPRNAVCLIEVALLTHRKLDGLEWLGGFHWGQRRSTAVCLPLAKESTSSAATPP
jgi:hypothetical protein